MLWHVMHLGTIYICVYSAILQYTWTYTYTWRLSTHILWLNYICTSIRLLPRFFTLNSSFSLASLAIRNFNLRVQQSAFRCTWCVHFSATHLFRKWDSVWDNVNRQIGQLIVSTVRLGETYVKLRLLESCKLQRRTVTVYF